MLPPSRISAGSLPLKASLQGALRRFAERGMRIGQIPGTAVPIGDFHRHARRQMLFQMRFRPVSESSSPILIRHEPKGQLRHRVAGDHGLGPRTLITAADAVDLRRRARPQIARACCNLFRRKAPGAPVSSRISLSPSIGSFAPGFALPIFERLHLVVESFDRDVAIRRRAKSRASCASAVIGFATAPPNMPECKSIFAPVIFTSSAVTPRKP